MASRSLPERWNRVRSRFSLTDLAIDMEGKVLAALGIGALIAPAIRDIALALVVVGVGLTLTIKAKHWKRFWS